MALDFNPFEADSKPAQTPQTKKQKLRAFDDPQIKPSAGSDQTPIKVISNSHQNQYQTPIKVISNSHQSGINQQAPRQQTDITTPITTPIKVVSNSHQNRRPYLHLSLGYREPLSSSFFKNVSRSEVTAPARYHWSTFPPL